MIRAGFELRLRIPAKWSAVEGLLHQLRRQAPGFRRFETELLLREALNNAVLHGCGCDPDKRGTCRMRTDARRVSGSGADEGCGFDWRKARTREAPLDAESGRGMSIYREYATRVRFSAAGNAIILVRRWTAGDTDGGTGNHEKR